MPKPWELDWSQSETPAMPTAKPWERDWNSAPDANDLLAKQGLSAKPPASMKQPSERLAPVDASGREAKELASPGVGVQPLRPTPVERRNPRTGLMMRGASGPLAITDSPLSGTDTMAEGAAQISNPNAKGTTPGRQIAGGASKIIRGGMEAATPLLPAAAVAAPVKVAAGLVAGGVGGTAGQTTAKALGASDEASDLVGDIAGIAAGGWAAKKAPGTVSVSPAKRASQKFAEEIRVEEAIRPQSKDINFKGKLQKALDHLAEENAAEGDPLKAAGAHEAMRISVDLAKKREAKLWKQYEAMVGDSEPVADLYGMSKAANQKLRAASTPEEKATALRELKQIGAMREYYKNESPRLRKMEDDLQNLNAIDSTWHRMNPVQQAIALRQDPTLQATVDRAAATRHVLYGALDSDAQGAAPSALKKEIGSLIAFRSYAEPRIVVSERQAHTPLAKQLAMMRSAFHAARAVASGDVASGIGAGAEMLAARAIAENAKSGNIIRDVIRSHEGRPVPIEQPATPPPNWAPGPIGPPNIQGGSGSPPPLPAPPQWPEGVYVNQSGRRVPPHLRPPEMLDTPRWKY